MATAAIGVVISIVTASISFTEGKFNNRAVREKRSYDGNQLEIVRQEFFGSKYHR